MKVNNQSETILMLNNTIIILYINKYIWKHFLVLLLNEIKQYFLVFYHYTNSNMFITKMFYNAIFFFTTATYLLYLSIIF